MCGRFNIIDDPLTQLILSIVNGELGEINLQTRYNIAPTEDVPVLLTEGESGFELRNMRWWLVPYWSSGPSTKYAMFNARSENLAKSRAFREPFKRRRCIVPASGYYEWQKQGGIKVPHLVSPESESGFAFAGLWDRWQGPDGMIESCTIITGAAPEPIAGLHHRIPLHLGVDEVDRWINQDTDADELTTLLSPRLRYPLMITPLSSYVGNSRNKDARCIHPLGEPWVVR